MKVPAVPPATFDVRGRDDVRPFRDPLWRVFRTTGRHPVRWNELRRFGPVPGMRFDPHPPPARLHRDIGVLYAATRPVTAFAEVFESTRVIDRRAGGATIASWTPTRTLELLDLTSKWPVRNGAAASLQMMDEKSVTQAWARRIFEQLGHSVDGLHHLSSVTNEPVVTLFPRVEAVHAFPVRPDFVTMLDAPAADVLVAQAVARLGYGVV